MVLKGNQQAIELGKYSFTLAIIKKKNKGARKTLLSTSFECSPPDSYSSSSTVHACPETNIDTVKRFWVS